MHVKILSKFCFYFIKKKIIKKNKKTTEENKDNKMF